MSWMAKLYETFESITNNDELNEGLEPYFHKKEPCHIEIILDSDGNFKGAESIVKEVVYGKEKFWKGEETIIPITPESLTGRTRGPAQYPLIDQIQYVAKDYPNYGGKKKSYFGEYFELLNSWATSKEFSHYKVRAIAKYVSKGKVVQDLIKLKVLFIYSENGKQFLIDTWAKYGPFMPGSKKRVPKPPLLSAVNANEQGNAKIRWRVQRRGDPNDSTWKDKSLIAAWQHFQTQKNKKNGFCQILGQNKFVFQKHQKGIYTKTNDAKLISIPTDESYLTYQGRFIKSTDPCTLSFEVSQKAHNMLRWLIVRQGQRISERVYVSWAVSGGIVPEPLYDTWSMFLSDGFETSKEVGDGGGSQEDHSVDVGQSFAVKLNEYINGYRIKLEPNEQIIIIGLDSATKGRMSVIYYRELLASEFLERLEKWHSQFAWSQRFSKEFLDPNGKKRFIKKTIWPISRPAPLSIVEAAYSHIIKGNDYLKKSAIERILPCIIDGCPFPRDIMLTAVRRASNRMAKRVGEQFSNFQTEKAKWEQHLGVACAIYKGFYSRNPNERRLYSMALEEDRKTRDYLYGRLLAIAEKIEEMAIFIASEPPRSTVASRLMQRFSDRPYSTWLIIEKGIIPYHERLRKNIAPLAEGYKKLIDDVCDAFVIEEFKSPKQLSGEYLLGFHSQRKWLREFKLEKGRWVRKSSNEAAEMDYE